MIKAYAGIGTRDIDDDEKSVILRIAGRLAKDKWICYSGNAPGSDQTFQTGSKGRCVIFLPWANFEILHGNKCLASIVSGETKVGDFWTKQCHDYADSLKPGARKLINRDAHQVVGHNAGYPMVRFVLCCATPIDKYKVDGGTNQAVQIANELGIPVFNIRVKGWRSRLKEFLVQDTK